VLADESAMLATAGVAIGYRSDSLGIAAEDVSPQYRCKHFENHKEEILGLHLGSESYRVERASAQKIVVNLRGHWEDGCIL